MTTERMIHSDLAIPPGEYLAEVLKARGISQAEIGRRMGRPLQAINEIIKGDKAITPDTALQLERALDVPAHIWTGLEAQYQLVLARQDEEKQLHQDVPLLKQIPYFDLVRLGFVESVKDSIGKVRVLQRFFGVSSLGNLPDVKAYGPAFRCSQKSKASPYALAAWLKCGEIRGHEMVTKPYSREALKSKLAVIRGLSLKSPKEFEPELKQLLADCGVVLAMLPHLSKTYANGATFWISPEKAVLLMSIRGSWADIFWFSLFHELAHILRHDKRMTFIEDGDANPEVKEQEMEADLFAADQLIPSKAYKELEKSTFHSPQVIQTMAQKIGIHAGIIVGRLQYDRYVPQNSLLNKLRARFTWTV
jgi:HTH-type transcriptional regulator / antitoxin HigA